MGRVIKTFVQGLIILAPVLLTVYVVVSTVVWLDSTMQSGLRALFGAMGLEPVDLPGVGVVVALAGIYLVGLVATTWVFQKLLRLGEAILERIPLVKSLYSAVKDLLSFLSGSDSETKGVPARLKLLGGKVDMLALVTQKNPEAFMGEAERGRVAVYLPMSYQIGGFTVFVDPQDVEEISDLTVEDVLKLSMTAGVGSAARGKPQPAAGAPSGPAPQ